MSDSQKPSTDSSDPWEQLAEDLFGLEYGKEHASREPEPPVTGRARVEASIAPDEPVRPAEERVEPAEEPVLEREPAGEPSAEVEFAFDEAEESSESTESAPTEPTAGAAVSAQDSYWDALANWNWDESEGGKGKTSAAPRSERPPRGGGPRGREGRDEGRGRRGSERPPRQASSAAAASPAAHRAPPAPPSTPDDFGLGVVEPVADFEATVEADRPPAEPFEVEGIHPPAEPAAPASRAGREERGYPPRNRGPGRAEEERGEEGDGHRKRRRRRRRRRSPGESGERAAPAATPEAPIPGADWEEDGGPAGESAEAPEEPGKEFGRPPEKRGREPRRSRDERRRPAPEVVDEPFEEEERPEEIVVAGGEEGDDGFEEGDDESEEQIVSYDNVPTWEEAISYLLHPNQVQVEPGAGTPPPRGGASGEAPPRQTRHVGHHKHRR